MDPTTLAMNALTVLTPYLMKGAEEFASAAGKDIYELGKSLLSLLKHRFADDKDASDELSRFEEKPVRYRSVIESVLKERLMHDSGLARELENLLAKAQPNLSILIRMQEGKDVTGLKGEMSAGTTARVEMEISKGEGITGAELKLGSRT